MIRSACYRPVLLCIAIALAGCGGESSSDDPVATSGSAKSRCVKEPLVVPEGMIAAVSLSLEPIVIDPLLFNGGGSGISMSGIGLSWPDGFDGDLYGFGGFIISGKSASPTGLAPRDGISISPGDGGIDADIEAPMTYVYFCAADASADDELSGVVAVSVESDGLPDHDTGTFPNAENPYEITEQARIFYVSPKPVFAETNSELSAQRFDAILANGVPVQMREATCTGSAACGVFDGAANPMHNPAMYGIDQHNAHVLADGSYHYHGDPGALYDDSGETAFQPIGVAADGFPVFGPWINDGGLIRKATSSYVLRTGLRTSDPAPETTYDGTFAEDYEYIEGHGDLDECNGRLVNGVYGYFVTDTFPYILNCLRGTPQPGFDIPDET